MNFIICKDRQRILDATGHILVTGGPGSGKTAIALAKAKKRIESGLLDGQSVLFLSFSRAAVGRVLEASKIQLPRETRTHLSIQTFHSFFWEILRTYGYLLGAPKKFRILLPHDERALRDGESEENDQWAQKRERLFRDDGRVAFDLFAPKVHQLLQSSNRVRSLFASRHPLVIIDEAQDTAEDQWQSVKLLAECVQLMCLADLDQQIYDFRPGVSAERVTHIMAALNPLRIDLESQNHRSPGSEIVTFGNDILLNKPRGAAYKGVCRKSFRPKRENRDAAIRSSVGMVFEQARKSGTTLDSIALLATWGRGVTIITKALTGDGITNRIAHRVMIDEAPVLISSRLVAFLMEPRRIAELMDVADGLELAAAVFRSKGGTSNLTQAKRLLIQADQARNGQPPKGNTAGYSLLELLRRLQTHSFAGESRRDWSGVRNYLSDSGAKLWADIGEYAEQLVAFQRGQHIASGLTELWQTHGNYSGARITLDAALAQDQLLSGGSDLRGIHVMTVHKSKGKEFDAVIILDDAKNSPLIYCREQHPHPRSRKLLRVGITRAKHQVLLLTDLFSPSALLSGHKL
jgi:DNA helicase-2/ATP-dependent DNA helicase PcrA